MEPGKAMQTILQVNAGNQGWNGAAEATGSIRAVTSSNAGGLASHITGPLGNAADNNKAFQAFRPGQIKTWTTGVAKSLTS